MTTRVLTATLVQSWIPKPRRNANKSDNGRILIIGGSKGMAGAAILCSMGAVRSGAGLVHLATVTSQQLVAAKRAPLEVMTQGLPEDTRGNPSLAAARKVFRTVQSFRPHVIALGPGLGQSKGALNLVKSLIWSSPVPLVLDADGLNLLSGLPLKKVGKPMVITPHEGELSRLLKRPVSWIRANRVKAAVESAVAWGCVCLLKGAGTLITDGRIFYKNPTGNPGMASGGMGDVLTGVIAALWGRMPERNLETGLRAAAAGAYFHGRAGDLAVQKTRDRLLLASDIVNFIPSVLQKVK